MMEVMSWWRKQCHCKGSSVMVNVAVLWWRKQCHGKGSSVMVEEVMLC